jgi:hypothetical protein
LIQDFEEELQVSGGCSHSSQRLPLPMCTVGAIPLASMASTISNSPKKKLSVLAFAGEKKLYRFTTVQKNKFYFRAGFFMRRDGAVKSRISAENEEDKVLFIFAN